MANELKTINLPGIGRYKISGSGGASSFSELTDTDFTNLQNGQVPVYNSTTEKWENGDGGSSLPTGGTQGQVLTKNSNADGDASWQDVEVGTIDLTSDVNGILPISNGGTGNSVGYIQTGKKSNTTIGTKATAEGNNTTASGESSHAEGYNTTASGNYSHAEGGNSTALNTASHAEGYNTKAYSSYSHAEGYYTRTDYNYQHVQGKYNNNKSTTLFEIGNGTADNARSNAFEVYQDGSLSQDNGSTKFKFTQVNGSDGYYDASDNFHTFSSGIASSVSYDNTTSGLTATNVQSAVDEIVDTIGDISSLPAGGAQGQVLTKNSSTDGDVSWATPAAGGVGKDLTGQSVRPTSSTTVTAGTNAEIFNDYRARTYGGTFALQGNVASGNYSHAEGIVTTASGNYSHAEGYITTASGQGSHAEGSYSTASGSFSHAEGGSTASGDFSHAEGGGKAQGRCSHAEGQDTIAQAFNHVQGHYSKRTVTEGNPATTSGDALIIGNGTTYEYEGGEQTTYSNCFRVTYAGAVYGLSSYNSSGADYAEFFEWLDGNTDNEDRVGYFVTLDGNKIKFADENDYVLGIISGQPSIVGNGDEDWLGRWMRDDFGRFLYDDVEIEDTETHEKRISKTIRPNPEYDSTKEYVERKDRQEWDYVGMLGALAVRDDGTCEVNGFCKCAEGGIATKADVGYRVIQRISENVIKVIFR